MAKRKSRAEIISEIEKLKKQLAEQSEAQERHIGKLANKAGLVDLDIEDQVLIDAFKGIAARFQNAPAGE